MAKKIKTASRCNDPVRAWLSERGLVDYVVEGGLEGLIAQWQRVVEEVQSGYDVGLDDYLDDMDGRQILEEALAVAPTRQRVAARKRLNALDAKMRALLVPAGRCLWGAAAATEQGWSAANNWWYFERPAESGPALTLDLRRRARR